MIKMRNKCIWMILMIFVFLMMIGTCAAIPYSIDEPELTILDHTMCKDVEYDFGSDPINRTTQFYTTDECAILWFEAKDVSPEDSFVVQWDDPDGQRYALDIISVYAEMPVMKYATR